MRGWGTQSLRGDAERMEVNVSERISICRKEDHSHISQVSRVKRQHWSLEPLFSVSLEHHWNRTVLGTLLGVIPAIGRIQRMIGNVINGASCHKGHLCRSALVPAFMLQPPEFTESRLSKLLVGLEDQWFPGVPCREDSPSGHSPQALRAERS